MRILLVSERFRPGTGGVEIVTEVLAEGLDSAGHEVTVLTNQAGPACMSGGYQVIRRPSWKQLIGCFRKSDRVILQGPAIRLGWPLLFRASNALLVHHMIYGTGSQRRGHSWAQKRLRRKTRQACVSRWLSRVLRVENILPNPYRDSAFKREAGVRRAGDVIFAGRLIPEKGAAVLIEAVAILDKAGKPVRLTIAGGGPRRNELEALTAMHRLQENVTFTGELSADKLAEAFQQHRVVAVPSLQLEGFGLVALEGLACGCNVVASDVGGLPEALGGFGISVPAGHPWELASGLNQALKDTPDHSRLQQHLDEHRPGIVIQKYLDLLGGPTNCLQKRQ